MRKERLIQGVFYLIFGALLMLAFFVSARLSDEPESRVEKISDFSVMLEGKEISALYYDGSRMWVGCNEGILVYDAETKTVVDSIDDLEIIYTSGIEQTPDGTVWVGHEEGLTGIGPDGTRIEFAYPDIPKGRINTVEWDQTQLWCGSYQGAARLELTEDGWKAVQLYGQEDGLISDSVNVIRSAGDKLWFASYLDHREGGITIVGNGEITRIGTGDGLPHPYITSLEELPDGRMLAGCGYMETGGLAVISPDGESFRVSDCFGREDGIPGEKVRYLYCDESGFLWITTEYDGVLVTDIGRGGLQKPLEGLAYTVEHGISDNEIKCIAETEEDYWLGGKYGLTLIGKSYIKEQMENK